MIGNYRKQETHGTDFHFRYKFVTKNLYTGSSVAIFNLEKQDINPLPNVFNKITFGHSLIEINVRFI